MTSGVQTAREIGHGQRVVLEREAHQAREAIRLKPVDAETGAEARRRLGTRFSIKGRWVGNRRLWDVYILEGLRPPKVAAAGFAFQEEAILCARDLLLGRLSVGFGGLRGVFGRGAGRLLVPSRQVEPAAKDRRVKVVSGPNGDCIVSR